ncbi:MAG: hypothetical protein ABIF17_04590 [Patescibacteria group bacterium]
MAVGKREKSPVSTDTIAERRSAKPGSDAIFYREKGKIKNTTNKIPNLSDVYKDKKDIPKLDFIQDDYNKMEKEIIKIAKKSKIAYGRAI